MKTKPLSSHWPLTLCSSLSALANLALPLVLARVLSPEDIGRYKIFFLYLGLMPWLSMSAGISNGLYHWAAKQDFKRYFNASWTLLLGWSFLITGLITGALGAALGPGSRVFAAGSFLILIAGFHEEALVAAGQTWRGAIFAASFDILRTSLVLATAIMTARIEWVFEAYVLGLGLKTFIGAIGGNRLGYQRLSLPISANREPLKSVLSYAAPVSLASLLAVFTHYADQLVLSRITTASYFAGYALGCLTIPPLNSFEQAVNRVLIPALGQLARERPGSAAPVFREAVAELSWILIPATAGLLVFADPIIRLLFTERYASVTVFLRLYAFNYLLLAFPYDAWARARGNSGWIFRNLLASFGVAILVIPLLAFRFQGVGALAGLLVTQLVLRAGGWIHIRRSTGWKTREFIPFPEISHDLSVAAALSALSLLSARWLGHGSKWFLICAPAFAAMYLGLTMRKRLQRHLAGRDRPAVLQLTQYLEMGGLERVIYSLCLYFRESREIDAYVLSYDLREGAHSLAPDFEQIGIPTFCNRKGPGFSPRVVLRIIRLCHREKIALLHAHDLGPLVYAAIAKLLTLGSLRIIHTQHSFVHLSKKRRHRVYEKIFTLFADELVTVSTDARETYTELGVSPERLHVIPNGVGFPKAPLPAVSDKTAKRLSLIQEVRDSREARLLQDSADLAWVLYLARIHPQKGQNWAIEAWKRLPETVRAKAALIFVGQESFKGETEKLRLLFKELSSPAHIVFAGVSQDPLGWLQASDLLLSLSEFEGMPLSPIEAYGSGLPLVLSRIPGHEIFGEDATPIDLPAGDDAGGRLAAAIDSVANEAFEERARRFALRAGWRDAYGLEKMAKNYLRLYAGRPSS